MFFQLAGGAVLAVGVWTLVEKSDYISLLNSGFYSASAYILIAAGVIVIVTGIIGCCGTLKEKRSLLIVVRWLSHTKHFPLTELIFFLTMVVSFHSTPFNYVESGNQGKTLLGSCLYIHNLVCVYVY